MKMCNLIFVFIFCILVFSDSVHARSTIASRNTETFKVQLILEIDTIKNGYLNLEHFFENYFSIINTSNKLLCFNEGAILSELDSREEVNADVIRNKVFYFPKVEYFNIRSNAWEVLDFYALIGDSSEPLPIVGDNILCLKNGDFFKYEGLLILKLMRFSVKGKYRICVDVSLKLNEEIIITNSSNYHYFYVL